MMKHVILGLLAAASLSAGQDARTFTGTITDGMCADGNHAPMRMGPTAAECTTACVMAHGALYVLYDGESTYHLSDQNTPEQFAGQRVRVVGRLDAKTKTIRVESITAAT
jgi:hypothetical protein